MANTTETATLLAEQIAETITSVKKQLGAEKVAASYRGGTLHLHFHLDVAAHPHLDIGEGGVDPAARKVDAEAATEYEVEEDPNRNAEDDLAPEEGASNED